jgi:SET domain-containing protein
MNKEELLKELTSNSFVTIKPSPIEGIGVFAIRDIPLGCRNMFSKPTPGDTWISLTKAEVEALPRHARALVENYCLFDRTCYFVPDHGFKKIDLSLFLNHSDAPNIMSVNDGDYFEALQDIKTGEELLIDYGDIVEDD